MMVGVGAMDNMTSFLALLSVIGTLSGIYLGWSAKGREQAKELKATGGAQAKLQSDVASALKQIQELSNNMSSAHKLQSDVEYIKRGVDEMRLEQKDQGRRFDELSERVTRVEESSKQAHKRIDRIEHNPPDGGAHD